MSGTCARVHLFGRVNSYQAFGLLGLLVAAALLFALAPRTSLGVTGPWLILGTCVVTFLLGVKLSFILFGRERVVFYEQALLVSAATALVLHRCGEPPVVGLDLTLIGLTTFLIFGRIGCLMVGCCYGRRARWGVLYGPQHVAAGLPPYYQGQRLLPMQGLESVLCVLLVSTAVAVQVRAHRPGEVAALLIVGYGVWRFFAELGRGDGERPYLAGLSEAQWLALGSVGAVALLGGALRGHKVHVAALLLLLLGAAVLVAGRRWLATTAYGLRAPHHVAELADALSRLRAGAGGQLAMIETSLGVRISYGLDSAGSGVVEHYGLSLTGGSLAPRPARALADVIGLLRGGHTELVASRSGHMFHVLLAR